MIKYNAVVSFPINDNGNKKNYLVTVYYSDRGLENDKIIELADIKIKTQTKSLGFNIEGNGTILKRDHVKKTIFQ